MKSQIRSTLFVTGSIIAISASVFAAPLNEAQITQIIKDVRTLDPEKPARAAKLRELLHSRQSIRTGIASRTELLFNDQTLTRIGANSHFGFTEGTRNLELYRGVIMLQVPKRAGGARIHTAAITAAITGTTILLESGPGYTKFIVVEGNARVTANNDKLQRKTTLRAGQAMIMPNAAKQVPPPVFVNLSVLVKTSRLISGEWPVELNAAPITAAIAQQKPENFTPTNIAIIGPGTDVVFLPENADFITITEPTPDKFGTPATIVGTTVITSATQIKTDPTITSNGKTGFGKIYRGPAVDGPASQFVFGNGSPPQPTFDTEFEKLTNPAVFRFVSLRLQGGPDIDTTGGPTDLVLASLGAIGSGGAGREIISLSQLNSLTFAALGPITLNSDLTFTGSNARLWLTNHGSGNDITVNSAINLSGLRIDAAGNLFVDGDINIGSGIWNSGGDLQVAAPVTASGSLKIQSAGNAKLDAPITTPSFDLQLTGELSGIGSIDAGRIVIDSGTPLTLSQTGGLSVNGFGIGTGSLQSLKLTADTINTPTNVSLPSVALGLSGTVNAPANSSITARTLTIENLTSPGDVFLTAGSGMTLGNLTVANSLKIESAGTVLLGAPITTSSFNLFLTGAGVLSGTGSISAGQIIIDSGTPLTLSQTGGLNVNGIGIGTGALQSLDLTANTINTPTDLLLGPDIDLTFSSGITGSSISGKKLNFGGAATFSGNVTSAGTIQGTSLTGNHLSFGGAATFSGDVTSAGTITGTSLVGNDLTFNGPATFTGAVTATNALVAGGTFTAASLSAKTVSFPNAKFNPSTLSQSGNSVIFNSLPIMTTGMTLLELGGSPLQVQTPVDLRPVSGLHLKLDGNVITGGNIFASTLTIDNLETTTGGLQIGTSNGDLTIGGSLKGNGRLTMSSPATIHFAGTTDAPGLEILTGSSKKISLSAPVRVKSFNADVREEFSSATPSAKLDAVEVLLNLSGAGTDGTFTPNPLVPLAASFKSTASVNSLSLDLTNTTSLSLRGAGDMTLAGNFAGSSNLTNFELRGASDVFVNGNITGSQGGGVRADVGSIYFGGTITGALRTIKLFAGTSIFDTSGLPVGQDHIAGKDVDIDIAGSSAIFSQTSPTRVNYGPLRLDVSQTDKLTLAANPLLVSGTINLPTVDLILNGAVQAPANVSLTARNLTLAHLTAPGSLTLNATTGTLTLNGGLVANDVTATFKTLAGTGSITTSQVKVTSMDPLALSQGAGLSLNGVAIGLGGLQSLDLNASTITTTALNLPNVNVTLGPVAGTSLSGNNLTFNGAANFTGSVSAANAFVAAGTFTAASLSAKTVSFPNAKFSSSTLSQSGSNVIFNGLPINTIGLTLLDVGGNPLLTTGDIRLGAANLVLAGNVIPGGDIFASTLTLDDLSPTTDTVRVSAFDGPLTIRGRISGNRITMSAGNSTINFANGFSNTNLDVVIDSSREILLGGTLSVKNVHLEARDSISSTNPGAKLDAEIVGLFLFPFGAGTDGKLVQNQTDLSTASFNDLSLDLTRTKSLSLFVDGAITVDGPFAGGSNLANLELRGGSDVFVNGNVTGDQVGVRADAGSISIGGKISALRAVSLFVGTSIIDTSPLPANEDHIAAPEVSITISRGTDIFSQTAPTRVGVGPLRIDVSQTSKLTLNVNQLQIINGINLPSVDLNLIGNNEAPGNTRLTARNLTLANLTTPGDVLLTASGDLTLLGNQTVSAGILRIENVGVGSSTTLNGTIRVKSLDLIGTSLLGAGTVDAETLGIDLNSPGFDGTFTKSGTAAGSFNGLTLDLTRTTSLSLTVPGNLTANVTSGFTNNPAISLLGNSGVQINGDLAVGSLFAGSNAGSISIGGKINALGSVVLSAGTNIIDTSGLPADQDHIAGQRISITVGGGPAIFSQTAPTRVNYGPLRLDLARTTDLTLSANPTQIVGSISLPGIALTVDGMMQASPVNSSRAFSPLATVNGSNLAFDVDSLRLGSIPRADAGIELSGGDANLGADAGSGGSLFVNAHSDIIVNAPITATTGRNMDSIATGGTGGSVDLTSQTGEIAISSAIEVSSKDSAQRRKSAKGGTIRLTSKKTTGTGIRVNSSGDLKALLDAAAPGPGGEITFISDGGDILVNGGKVTADRGTIDIRNNGPTGLVHLNGATLAADAVKIGALGNDGVLRIGGGSIDANTTIRLYAGGSNGTVDFVDDVSLSGSSVKTIAAKTVNIVNGKVVTVSGPAARVFTDNANYTGSGGNGSKTGTFSGSGANTFPHDHPAKPPF